MEPVRCVHKGIHSVTLEVSCSSPGPPTAVELLEGQSWLLPGTWVPAPHVECVKVQGEAPLYHVTLARLAPETEYQVRLLWEGNPYPLLCACRTAGRPPVLAAPLCVERRPDAVAVEWTAPNLEGAETLECQLEWCGEGLFSRWEVVQQVARAQPEQGRGAGEAELWRGTVSGLSAATDHFVRVRARNAAGWSPDFSPALRCRTSDAPAPPRRPRAAARRIGGVTLEFEVEDPEGAPVLSVQAEALSLLQWHALAGEHGLGPPTPGLLQRRGWVSLTNLPVGTDTLVRLWAVNAVGRSLTASEQVKCRPADRPAPICSLECTGRWPDAVEVEWRTDDPEGAPVEHCALEYGRNQLLTFWQAVKPQAIERMTTRGAGGISRWRARIDGLEPESAYVARACARNEVGSSEEQGRPLEVCTAGPPSAPCKLRCVQSCIRQVQIEFEVACDPAQLRCTEAVTAVAVERAGLLVWASVPRAEVDLEPLGLADAHSGQHFLSTDAEGCHVRGRVTIRELAPDTWYTFRLWVANEVGWNKTTPTTIDCHTALRPEAPSRAAAAAAGPHSLQLSWHVPDPDGAPVLECEAQIRENSVFASWRAAPGTETQRRSREASWEQLSIGLAPAAGYLLRVRARNAVDWSAWSQEVSCSTSSGPEVARCKAQPVLVAGATAAEVGMEACAVDVIVPDPAGAPIYMCTVTSHGTGRTVLARKVGDGRWRAHLHGSCHRAMRISARAANAVAWSLPMDGALGLDPPAHVGPSHMDAECLRSSIDHVVRTELAKCRATEQKLVMLLAAREGPDQCTAEGVQLKEGVRAKVEETAWPAESQRLHRLRDHAGTLSAVIETLQGLDEGMLGEVEGPNFGSWPERCQACLETWPPRGGAGGQGQEHGKSSAQALQAFRLLVEGAIWLERLRCEALEPVWQRICARVHEAPQGARAFHLWAQERETWSERFQGQLLVVWQDGMVTALRLLAAAASSGALGEAEAQLPKDLLALRALRGAAEQQLRKLRRIAEMLMQVTDCGASRGFDQMTMLDKISQTALGLLLSAVLPVPGSMELGAFTIGTLWLKGDTAGRHAAVEHPREHGADAPMLRFRQQPRPEAARLLHDWAAGACDHAVLVHNATARVITARLLEGNEGLAARAYTKIQQAHPLARLVAHAVERCIETATSGSDSSRTPSVPSVILAPAGVGLIPMPPPSGASGASPPLDQAFDVEFAYGIGNHAERAVGRIPARRGAALSFVCFDHEVSINNRVVGASSGEASAPESMETGREPLGGDRSRNRDPLDAEAGEVAEPHDLGDAEGNTVGKAAEAHCDEGSTAGKVAQAHELGDEGKATGKIAEPHGDLGDEGSTTGEVAEAHDDEGSTTGEVVEGHNLGEAGTTAGDSGVVSTNDHSAGIEVRNNDFAPVRVLFYHLSTQHFGRLFEKPTLTASLAAGERQLLRVPVREDSASHEPPVPSEGVVFEVEVHGATGKTRCNVAEGQVLCYEGCL